MLVEIFYVSLLMLTSESVRYVKFTYKKGVIMKIIFANYIKNKLLFAYLKIIEITTTHAITTANMH